MRLTGGSRILLLLLALGAMSRAFSATPAVAAAEIRFLLDDLGASGCEFYRNGSWYGSRLAEEHLRSKYLSLGVGNHIRTAEDFIEQAATRSSVSGEPYRVRCAPAPATSTNRWLRERLARYRDPSTQGTPRSLRDVPPY